MPVPLALPIGLAAAGAGANALGAAASHRGRFEQLNTRRPDQIAAQQQALQYALSGLQNPTAGFAPIAQQAQQDFATKYVPSLAERFTSLGGQRSSGFQSALQQGAQGLSSNLAAQQAQYGLQNQGLLQQLLGLGLQPSFENYFKPPEPGFLGGIFGGIGNGLTSAGGASLDQYFRQKNPYKFGNSGFSNNGGGQGGSDWINQLLQALMQIKNQQGY